LDTIRFKIHGATLLMHNIRLANPLDPGVKKIKALTSVRKKSDETHAQLSDLEFEYGLYHDKVLGPYIPGSWMDICLINGGKLQKNGSKISRSCLVLEDMIPLNYKGPRDIESLKADLDFRLVNSVNVGKQRIMRTRPLFRDWSCEFTVQFDPKLIDRNEIIQALMMCGQCLGTGDFRPRYGRFTVEVI
jgi:hypothetical protein